MSPIFRLFGGGKMGLHLHTPKHEQKESNSDAHAYMKESTAASVATLQPNPLYNLAYHWLILTLNRESATDYQSHQYVYIQEWRVHVKVKSLNMNRYKNLGEEGDGCGHAG